MTIVSNSEASTFLQCERRHYYAHIMKIAPKQYSQSLSRGIIGHEALAIYYTFIKNAKTIEDYVLAENAATNHVMEYMKDPSASPEQLKMLGELITILNRYFDYYDSGNLGWDILAVEQQYDYVFNDGMAFAMRLDLLVRIREGRFAGKIAIVDHKFVYDFKSNDDLMLNVQLPKYIATLRANGIEVHHGILNQLRHRQTKTGPTGSDAFRRDTIVPDVNEMRQVMREHVQITERISERKALPIEVASQQALRVLNELSCKNCPYRFLCKAELSGQNVDLMLASEFEPNTYTGYEVEGVKS